MHVQPYSDPAVAGAPMAASMPPAVRSPATQNRKPGRLLVVDDDRTVRTMLQAQLLRAGHQVEVAEDGEQALSLLRAASQPIDTVLLDRTMPGLSGLDVVTHMKHEDALQHVPIVMLTGANQPNEIREGINTGVYYYLTKPADESFLLAVVEAAIRDAQQRRTLTEELARNQQGLRQLQQCRFQFQNLDEIDTIAVFIASCYPEPQRVLNGLQELMINAVEHGNLQISYADKSALMAQGLWREEVAKRLAEPDRREQYAELIFQRKEDCLLTRITDKGQGFDWRRYMEIDASRATDAHGRGVATANLLSFDKLLYNDAGNQVTAVLQTASETKVLAW